MYGNTKGGNNAEKKINSRDIFFPSIRYFLRLGLCEGTL